jgi:hypothetical protein
MKKHNHPSDDRLIQYRGKYSRRSRRPSSRQIVMQGRGEADRRDQTRWCVGLTIDPKFGHIYWTQKGPDNAGLGRIFRASVEIPAGQTSATRSDIEIFFDGLPEPIELDHKNCVLYWTDRGDPPRGNTVNGASIDNKPVEPEIVVTQLMEGIGIALDIEKWSAFERHKPSYRFVTTLDARRLPTFN